MVQEFSAWRVLTRRKVLSTEGVEGETKLNRVLGLYDLTALGVGSTLGAGVYVLAGKIARDEAGPSVMLSFAIAALASLLAGVCYAEFGARVPKAGSAYVYSYVCIGEFVAFVIGWNLILEYVIGTAAVCRGISLYLDTLINDTLKETFQEIAPINVSFLGSYFDFFAFGLVVIFGVALAFGVETSTMANNFCTCLNISILLFVIIAGSIKADFSNWTIDPATVTNSTNVGSGGYFPFGFEGTLKGAATCFFGFVGFDCIATTGEEVRNPRKNIPRSILLSLLIIFLCYFGVSTVLTLMVPYYLQDPNAPLPYAFKEVGWDFAMWVVAIGGLIGLIASLFGALFPLPRVMYSMAEDGLLFRFLGKISPRYQVPVTGSIFAAILTALIAGLFDLAQLVNLLSIGTLLAYSVVAISVTILRYMDNSVDADRINGNHRNGINRQNANQNSTTLTENSLLNSSGTRLTFKSVLIQSFNFKRVSTPNSLSARIVGSLIILFCLLSVGIGVILMEANDALAHKEPWVVALLAVLVVSTVLVLLAICVQPREGHNRIFRVPFVPVVPAISIFINIYLMLQLDVMTWIRFGIWMAIGLPMLFACCRMKINNQHGSIQRIAFAKALKESSAPQAIIPNGHLRADRLMENGTIRFDGNYSANNTFLPDDHSTNTMITTQNEHSVRSLDEIMNMSDVSEDLIEMRHPNGKIFYIEDSKSNLSTITLNRTCASNTGSDTAEDEKSVIAILDDVLDAADDDTVTTNPNVSRQFSMDSEMWPAFIESTTEAIVHSSDSSDVDLEIASDTRGEVRDANSGLSDVKSLPTTGMSQITGPSSYVAESMAAERFVDELFNSEELWQELQERLARMEAIKNNTAGSVTVDLKDNTTSGALDSGLVEDGSDVTYRKLAEGLQNNIGDISHVSSRASVEAVADPMHSDSFKDRLSKLIMERPFSAVPANKSLKKEEESAAVVMEKPKMKSSKSETDVRALLLQAIEAAGNKKAAVNSDADGNANSADAKKLTNGDVPKPPTFDPVLYHTVNSSWLKRKREALSDLNKETDEHNNSSEKLVITEPMPPSAAFREKLEAALKQGPSYHTQKRLLARAESEIAGGYARSAAKKANQETKTKEATNDREAYA